MNDDMDEYIYFSPADIAAHVAHQRELRGRRKHAIRVHGTNNPDACDCPPLAPAAPSSLADEAELAALAAIEAIAVWPGGCAAHHVCVAGADEWLCPTHEMAAALKTASGLNYIGCPDCHAFFDPDQPRQPTS